MEDIVYKGCIGQRAETIFLNMDKNLEWNQVVKPLIPLLRGEFWGNTQMILINAHELGWAATAKLFMYLYIVSNNSGRIAVSCSLC